METAFIAFSAVTVYLSMWMAVARWHYHWWWENDTTTKEERRRISSGFVGLFWPLTSVWLVLYGLTALIGWAETTPSIGERREKRVKAKHERLRDLQKQIERAEAELCEAGNALKAAHEDGTPLTRYGSGIDITPR
jgi:hypothetical protein